MMLPLKCYVEKNGSFSRRIRFVEKNHFESDFDLNDIQSITRVECYFVDRDINLEDTWVILAYLAAIRARLSVAHASYEIRHCL
jgi:hypothetical protein